MKKGPKWFIGIWPKVGLSVCGVLGGQKFWLNKWQRHSKNLIWNEVQNWGEWKLRFVYCVWQWKGKKHVSMFCREIKVAFILIWFAFGDGKGLRTKRKEIHGYVLWRKTTFIFYIIRVTIIWRRFCVYSLHRKCVFDFCCWKVWGLLKCKNLWVWSGKCVKWVWSNKWVKWVWNGKRVNCFWLQLLEGSIVG